MKENWDEFILNLFEAQRENYNKTDAGRHRRATDLANYTRLENELSNDQRAMVDAIIFDRCVALEQEGQRLYEQGLKDGIWLVQKLDVFGLEV